MFTMLQQDISNSKPKFESQSSSYKRDTKLTRLSLCIQSTDHVFIYILNDEKEFPGLNQK